MISCACIPLQQTSCWGSLIKQPIEQDLVRSSRRWSGEASQDARERSEGAASLNATRMSSRKIALPSQAARSPRVSTAMSPGPRIPTVARTARIPEGESFAPKPELARAPCSGGRWTAHCAESSGERGLVLGDLREAELGLQQHHRARSASRGGTPPGCPADAATPSAQLQHGRRASASGCVTQGRPLGVGPQDARSDPALRPADQPRQRRRSGLCCDRRCPTSRSPGSCTRTPPRTPGCRAW